MTLKLMPLKKLILYNAIFFFAASARANTRYVERHQVQSKIMLTRKTQIGSTKFYIYV